MKFSEWIELREVKDACYHKVMSRYEKHSAYASGAMVQCRKVGARNWGNSTKKVSKMSESAFSKEDKEGLHGWFSRNGGKGWVDCKASKKGHIVPCGRNKTGKGAEREYPACRPTLSMCNSKGKKRKKGPETISWK